MYVSNCNGKIIKMETERLIMGLELYVGHKIDPNNSLLIFDEVQEVPRALASLKYFYENAPEYHIVCAGSLLGIALYQGTSFPVGKVDFSKHAPNEIVPRLRMLWNSIPAQLAKENKKFIYGLVCEGALTEQYVCQQLKTVEDLEIYYYTNDRGTCEVDFVVDTGERIVPVEVKAEINLKAKSLKTYREKFSPEVSVRTSMADFKKEEWLVNLPLYAVDQIITVTDI